MKNMKLVSKLEYTKKQWVYIVKKEMSYREDLRNHERLAEAEEMIVKLDAMIENA